MQTLEAARYTRLELYWIICRYCQEFNGRLVSERTFRHWRQKLEIIPDQYGLYWHEDLERLKEVVRRISQGQTLDQIAQMIQENSNNAT